jgi:hypothetical protein
VVLSARGTGLGSGSTCDRISMPDQNRRVRSAGGKPFAVRRKSQTAYSRRRIVRKKQQANPTQPSECGEAEQDAMNRLRNVVPVCHHESSNRRGLIEVRWSRIDPAHVPLRSEVVLGKSAARMAGSAAPPGRTHFILYKLSRATLIPSRSRPYDSSVDVTKFTEEKNHGRFPSVDQEALWSVEGSTR